ncbi:hypothetical protein [Paludisphaera sp.]|uniref:hypothetical protein n=1 Tax=Paludisphaera sp. TaxID=2017432 RepID=UPI00301D6466
MLALLLIVGSTLQAPAAPSQDAKPPAEASARERPRADDAKATDAPADPKEALREFFLSMIKQDEEAVREAVVDDEDLEWLLKGPKPPADQLDKIEKSLAEAPLRALKAGDEVTTPGGGKAKVEPDDVSDDRALIVMGDGPPLRLQKVDGRWRVDARPIIAARKAAAKASARKKAG